MAKLNEEKGVRGEREFMKWLKKHRIPFIRFDQSLSSYSDEFWHKFKRPDFMLLIRNFGFILVDTKNQKTYKRGSSESIAFKIDEVKEYKKLHKEFGVQIWFAVCDERDSFKSWHWISINEFEDTDKKVITEMNNKEFYAPELNKFIEINCDEGIGNLFEK